LLSNMPEWKVDGYTELKALGSGGFGDVMLARHDASNVLVAIKYLRQDLLTDQEFAEMFRDEAAVLASLNDANVVRLYEYVESSSGAAIIMELIDGVTLHDILANQGSTTAEAALVVLQGSLMGLAAAHQRGVVHRDYKPQNVLVNGDGVSKLTDFGIAARSGDRPPPAGTLAYAAPEQMAGGSIGPASDIYSATATFYECLTGQPPFSGEPAELLHKHRYEPVPLDLVPGPLQPLVAAGMAKDPRRRPTDATTFSTQLASAAAGAYGRHWQEHGRSHLGEAALLLAALWPAGAPPAVQGATVYWISLFRRTNVVKAAVTVGAAILVVAAGTALAAADVHKPDDPSHSAMVELITLQASPSLSPSSPPPSSRPPSPSPSSSSPQPPAPAPSSFSPPPPAPPQVVAPTSRPPSSRPPSSRPPSTRKSSSPPSSSPPSSAPPTTPTPRPMPKQSPSPSPSPSPSRTPPPDS
jgi:eukaryotic-like serine/threonine-protein kinase